MVEFQDVNKWALGILAGALGGLGLWRTASAVKARTEKDGLEIELLEQIRKELDIALVRSREYEIQARTNHSLFIGEQRRADNMNLRRISLEARLMDLEKHYDRLRLAVLRDHPELTEWLDSGTHFPSDMQS